MKTPLQAISSYIQLSLERLSDLSDVDDIHAFLSKALYRSHDLRDIIENILLQGRLEADRYEVCPVEIAIKPLMERCAEKVAAILLKNRNRIHLSGQEFAFVSDEEVLRHIVGNLLSNACKFTLDGTIELKWFRCTKFDYPSL
jgi:signal transduction histidine kinase